MITETQLIDFALNNLTDEDRKRVEHALRQSSQLQCQLAEIEELLSQTALTLTPRSPSPSLRQRILDATADTADFSSFIPRLEPLFDLSAHEVQNFLNDTRNLTQAPWVESGITGVNFFHLQGGPRTSDADCGFVHILCGNVFPAHRHKGDEWSFILQGQFEDGEGKVFRPGDMVYQASGTIHSFKSSGDEDLVFAVVLHKGFEII